MADRKDKKAEPTLQANFTITPEIRKKAAAHREIDKAIREALSDALILVLEKKGILDKEKRDRFGIEDAEIDWKPDAAACMKTS
jgi:hypothetical protein